MTKRMPELAREDQLPENVDDVAAEMFGSVETRKFDVAKNVSKDVSNAKTQKEVQDEDEITEDTPYPVMMMDDIEDMPDPEFMIDRILPLKGWGLIWGNAAAKKSFIVLDMILHIAYGFKTYHGDDIYIPEKKRKVLYIIGEGAMGIKTRIRAFKKQHGIDENTENFLLIPECPDFLSKKDTKRLVKTIRKINEQVEGIGIIVIDTVARAIPGGDENSQIDMGMFVKAVTKIGKVFDCLVIGVHHSAKGGGIRGSSSLRGSLDFSHRMTSESGSMDVEFYCDKMKDGGSDGWKDHYRMTEYEVGVTKRGKTMTSLAVSRMEPKPAEKESDGELSYEHIMLVAKYLQESFKQGTPLRKTTAKKALPKMTGLSGVVVEAALDFLIKHGLFELRSNGGSGTNGLKANAEKMAAFVEENK